MASKDQMDLFSLADVTDPTPPKDFNPDLIPTDVKVPILPGTYVTMDIMKEHCNRCQRCELGATRTNAVVGRGNEQADLMIVGEGPGQNEDETGLPFVGKAGQLLDKILASVNLTEKMFTFVTLLSADLQVTALLLKTKWMPAAPIY